MIPQRTAIFTRSKISKRTETRLRNFQPGGDFRLLAPLQRRHRLLQVSDAPVTFFSAALCKLHLRLDA